MIVLDEQLNEKRVLFPLRDRFGGRVIPIREFRPKGIIKDEAIPELLLRKKKATFVTINVADFWRKIPPHAGYCILCFPLPTERQNEIPQLIIQLVRHPDFKTAANRMGKVLRVTAHEIWYYAVNSATIQKVLWI